LSSGEDIPKELNAPVRDCMRIPLTVSPVEAVSSLRGSRVVKDLGAVMVVEQERPVGMMTEKDVLERVIMKNKTVYTTTAKEVMAKPLISIERNRL
jgi:CBS domain-containing protein